MEGTSDTDQAQDKGQAQGQAQGQGATTFTQVDIDRIVRERLAREQAKFSDYEALKAQADELQKLKAAQMSEAEKLQAKLADLERRATEAEQQRQVAMARVQRQAAEIEIINQASVLDFEHPADVARLIDWSGITYDEDGKPIGIRDAVEAVAQARPGYLRSSKKQAQATPKIDADKGAGGGSDGGAKLNAEQELIAKRLGIKPEAYAKRLSEMRPN